MHQTGQIPHFLPPSIPILSTSPAVPTVRLSRHHLPSICLSHHPLPFPPSFPLSSLLPTISGASVIFYHIIALRSTLLQSPGSHVPPPPEYPGRIKPLTRQSSQ
jgi:hypothetical protein